MEIKVGQKYRYVYPRFKDFKLHSIWEVVGQVQDDTYMLKDENDNHEEINIHWFINEITFVLMVNDNLDLKQSPTHYDNSKGSIYQFCNDQSLNSYEFDIIKRIVRCRKKGQFKEDLEKTKFLIDLYLKEHGN